MTLLAGPTRAAVREVEALPNAAALRTQAASLPAAAADHQRALVAMYERGDDAGIARRLAEIDGREPALAAELRERLAGAYLRDRRLYRATGQLDAIPAARRTDQARFMAANIAARQRRLQDALRELDALAVRLPLDPLVARDQAQIASLLGEHARAAAACERLLGIASQDEFGTFLLARTRMQQGRTSDAERLLAGLFARNPRHGRAALNLGLLKLAAGDSEAAIRWFVQARSMEGRDATPYVAEAAARLLEGNRSEGRAAVAGAVEQNAGDPLTGLLDLLLAGGSRSRLVNAGAPRVAASLFADLEREPLPAAVAREIGSPGSAGRIAVANLLLAQWSPQAALQWLSRPGGGPDGPLAESAAIRALAASGDLQAARSRATRLADSPQGRDLAGTALQRADIALRLDDPAGALKAMQQAVARAPLARVHASSGDVYRAAGRLDDALSQYRAALGKSPDDPGTMSRLAAALALTGSRSNAEEGLAVAEKGLSLRPDYVTRARLLDARADALDRLGRTREAFAAYRQLSTTVGGMASPEPWHRLGELALAVGDRAAARKAFEEALDYGRGYTGRQQAEEELARLDVGVAAP